MAKFNVIRFKGRKYLLIGSLDDGAIATAKQYANGDCSYAYLMPDGKIMRYNEQIGTRDDLEFLGETDEPKTTLGSLWNVISKEGKGWRKVKSLVE